MVKFMCSAPRTFYVTTPIYYVTAKPHLGSLYSTVLADVAARWHQLRGEKVFFLTGTDEHGQKIAQAAQAAGATPRNFVDSFIASFTDAWKKYDINYTHFVRTTDASHIHAVQQWIRDAQARGDIYRATYDGYYCTPCETFVVERDDAGSAPSGGARLVSAPLVGTPKCPSCGRDTILVSEPSYFFKLSAYQQRLLDFYDAHPEFIVPAERINEVRSFVASGLKDLAISRSRTAVSWGIPFPGDEEHVVYVWADALNNYISAIGYADPTRQEEFARWWPAQLQILGKDIVRFHAVFWPAFLMSAGLALPQRLLVHGWIKVEGQKMSKSLGNVVDPMTLVNRYGVDAVRYYLTRYIAITQDSSFSYDELETRVNADLADDLGNLVQRLTSLALARGFHKVQPPKVWGVAEQQLWNELAEIIRLHTEEMGACMFHRAYAHLWRGITLINAYVHAQQPWKLPTEQRERVEEILAAGLHGVTSMAMFAWPVMPAKMEQLLARCGVQWDVLQAALAEHGMGIPMETGIVFTLTKGDPLFPKLEKEEKVAANSEQSTVTTGAAATAAEPSYITIDDFAKVELLVGTITAVAEVPKSDKLYQLTVDLGPHGIRTICSGVRMYFKADELLGQQGVFVANLAPRKMMGIPSQGMMLFAKNESGGRTLVKPAASVPNGSRLD